MTSQSPRYIGPFKRTHIWTAGLVLAVIMLALSVYTLDGSWGTAVRVLFWLIGTVAYAVVLRRELQYNAQHELR